MLAEMIKNKEIAKKFNQYFGHITDSLDLYECPDIRLCDGLDDIDDVVHKFRNHQVS